MTLSTVAISSGVQIDPQIAGLGSMPSFVSSGYEPPVDEGSTILVMAGKGLG